MTSPTAITDEELVAYLDGAIEPARRRDIDAALVLDAELAVRLAGFEVDKDAIRSAFEKLAGTAPVDALRRRLDAEAVRSPRLYSTRSRWLGLAAALVIGIGLGLAIKSSGIFQPARGWHEAVADYQVLYSPATLASVGGEAANLRGEVAAVAARLGLPIELERLQIDGLELKRAQLLEFEGKPLAQFAYRDAAGLPVAFCAIRTGETDSAIQTGRLRGLPVAFWNSRGYGFIVIGATPAEALKQAAAVLARRI